MLSPAEIVTSVTWNYGLGHRMRRLDVLYTSRTPTMSLPEEAHPATSFKGHLRAVWSLRGTRTNTKELIAWLQQKSVVH